jgi:hypothetical protein
LARICSGLVIFPLFAAEHHGQVTFNGLPVPGVGVTVAQGGKTFSTITDTQGTYAFADLPDGVWTIQMEMQTFSPIRQDVTVTAGSPAAQWELKLLPLAEIEATIATNEPAAPPATASSPASSKAKNQPAPANTQTAFQRANLNAAGNNAAVPAATETPAPSGDSLSEQNIADVSQRAADGFLINGTTNNGASSPFAQNAAFGNNRRGPASLYNGNVFLRLDNSALDARTFSLTGQDTPRPAYTHVTAVVNFGGPLNIPHLTRNGPNFFIEYRWTRDRAVSTQTGLMPTADEHNGILPDGSVSPISPQAAALLSYYPLPNFTGSSRYNYQIPVIGANHQDGVLARLNKTLNRKNQVSGAFGLQSTRSDNPNLFGFLDTSSTLGVDTSANWRHNFTPRFFTNLGFRFTRQAARITPFFENRLSVSGLAGISGNNQDPVNWGPPTLNFFNGITDLTDALPSFNRNQTGALSLDALWNHGRHNISFGGDYRKQQFNILSQQDPRGNFTFTGGATGSAFGDFLAGIPDTSSIAFGNADKYLRASSYDAYVSDDWRMNPSFTLNAGIRWEYWSPITELYDRLINLDIVPGFSAESPVLASSPIGPLTGMSYPDSLLHPDKHAFQPRVGFSWRPLAASSMIIRGGYGMYYNTSIYQNIATQMAQQYPLSKSLTGNNATNPLTLANGFIGSPLITPNTFGIDPDFRVGFAQNWQLSIQRDLPASLQMTATYLGTKGTRGVQEFLPNTYPIGAVNPCPSCPSGFAYMTSNGNSTREAGQIQLRRRLHNGLTATLQYTFSKAIDDAALGGKGTGTPVIAQNWLNLSAERGLSTFDQRHVLTVQGQYTTGMGLGGGALVGGWKGALFKGWTVTTQINAASGLPLTPVFPVPVIGTGVTGPVRPDYTRASVYAAPSGLYLNPAAFTAPFTGQWGNVGRDSITGPSQFSLSASLGRTFRMSDRTSVDLRVDTTNALNHVTFPSWNTTVGNAQFGLPNQANAMRNVQTTLRFRF